MRAEAPWPLDSLAAPGPREAAERTTASPARRAHAAQRNRRGGNGTGDGRRVSAKESIQVTVPRRGPGTAPAHVPGVPVPDLSLQSGHLHVPSSSRRIHSSALRTAGGNPGHSAVSASCEFLPWSKALSPALGSSIPVLFISEHPPWRHSAQLPYVNLSGWQDLFLSLSFFTK